MFGRILVSEMWGDYLIHRAGIAVDVDLVDWVCANNDPLEYLWGSRDLAEEVWRIR